MTRSIRLLALLAILSLAGSARADSVAQVGTSIRIGRGTAILIDPQGRPGVMGTGTTTAVMPGDVLSFVVHFTPVPNGAVRGLGGYITVYIPRNTEVVGARFVDSMDRTVRPHRGGLAADGVGPRGTVGFAAPLVEGSLSQLYADTGIFYSTDPLTERRPNGPMPADRFLTLFNGLEMVPAPTAYGQLQRILGSGATGFAHNQWDLIQVFGFGVGGGAINSRGSGNAGDMYGSPVAGPDTWYPYEASYVGDLSMPLAVSGVRASATTGPWIRLQTWGGEIGRRGALPPMPDPGRATRVGVLALDATGAPLGEQLDGDHPLPSFDPASPTSAFTRAVRYAVGELVVGEEYLVEINLRVLATPLDPISGSDVVCAEVFGGDASSEEADGSSRGKDNAWRYFLPAPACVSLPLLFDFDVDRLTALTGDRLTYTIHGKNLSTTAETNVVVRECFTAGDLTFVSATMGGVRGAGAACPNPGAQDDVTWMLGTLDPGEEYDLQAIFDVAGGGRITISRATYTSDQLPAPGFSVVAATDIQPLTIIDLAMTATPDRVTAPARVRYRATVGNRGTGAANVAGCGGTTCGVYVTLPSGFTYVPGSARVGGAAAPDPAITGRVALFTGGLTNIPPGGMLVVEWDADVPVGTAPGAYPSELETWLDDPGGGTLVNDTRAGLAEVLVGIVRSEPPVVSAPLFAGATTVGGTTSEAAGTTIRVYLRGILVASTTSDAAGRWTATVPTLFAGERVSATAQAAGELESLPSAEVAVSAVGSSGPAACSDGVDNDLDGLVDFPADPDCESAADLDEEHTPICANGLDDDGDGAIDFGADDGCSSLVDDTEDGGAECGNGVDDDGDGTADFPGDPGCTSATDPSERDVPACANGLDDDGDGAADHPLDPGCDSALDTDESTAPLADAGSGGDAASAPDAGAGDGASASDAGGPPDPGGVPAPGGGCGCTVPTGRDPRGLVALAALATLLARRRRRR